MDELLMLHAITRWCADCAATTLFVPTREEPSVETAGDDYCCTACDAAVVLAVAA